ncbi:formimidoylglutamase [Aeromicrobium ponti]|uniref:Formimidoylglutamase n=1 Tax=Cytobacillus oceanisediminis TaxID=665099 RepID=A0A562K2P2_9BACI|nr:formimidoylglutamase [Cytobacillus oceanisediminis]TWH89699.1 formiminoglutamase [Cytobacillus oceanisediminis]
MYIQPSSNHWSGRIDSETDPLSFRFHQQVKLMDLAADTKEVGVGQSFGLIGFRCDEGVIRNRGRRGAAKAPEEVRLAIAKLPWHLQPNANVFDTGDIACVGENMEEAQVELGKAVSSLFKKGVTPFIIGGGHETFYGHYLGVREYLGPEASVGIINIDAHFDMRPYDQQTSSGTMFKQILDQDQNCGYLAAGIQKLGNTAALFETARKYNVSYILEEQLLSAETAGALKQIDDFAVQYDTLILTLCTDAINSSFAPGVSAPSPFGLDPKTVRKLVRYIVSKDKTISFDVCEVNPSFDEGKKTIALAAHFIMEALMNFNK